MSEFKIDKPGLYVTRDGRKVEVLKVGLPGKFAVAGVIYEESGVEWWPKSWNTVGTFHPESGYGPHDIVGPWVERKKPRLLAWRCRPNSGTPGCIVMWPEGTPVEESLVERCPWLDQPEHGGGK